MRQAGACPGRARSMRKPRPQPQAQPPHTPCSHTLTCLPPCRRFPLLAIAPEATTKAQPCLLKFRRGAFSAGQPVCPVLLRYRYRHFNPSE